MSTAKKIALIPLGIGLTMAGVLILPFGFFALMVDIAWSNGSAQDLFLMFLDALYAIPAGFGSLIWGIVLLRSMSEETYVRPSAHAQKRLGLCLLLPVIAALLLLVIGYPHYRLWAFDASLGIFLVLFAAALFAGGIYLIKDAQARAHARGREGLPSRSSSMP